MAPKRKKASLSSALNQAAGKEPVEPTSTEQPVADADQSAKQPKDSGVRKAVSGNTYVIPPSRRNTKGIAGHFPPEVAKQFKALCLDLDISVQKGLEDAIGDWFEKHGKPRLM